MRFRLDDAFAPKSAQVTVTYLDKGKGTWSMEFGESRIEHVQNTNSGLWKTKTVPFSGASEIVPKYESGDDTRASAHFGQAGLAR